MSHLAPDDRVSPQDDAMAARSEDAQLGDISLVVGIGRGRTAALAEVYRRYGGALYDMAMRVCGPDRAEDVVRTVLMDLWRQPGRFDPDRSTMRAFLLRQAHASAVEVVRAGGPRAGTGTTSGAAGKRSGSRTLDLAALAGRTGDHAWALLSCLPDDERDAVALAYSCGYSSRDLSGLLDEPEATVNARMRSGLTGLGRRTDRPTS